MSAPSDVEMYHAAVRLAKAGQPVFPCRPAGAKAKAPLTTSGLKDASLDPKQIRAWWSKHRGAAIGIPTGVKWDVLDVDTKGEVDGRMYLPGLQKVGLLNGCQFVVRTPSGGWHLYFNTATGLTNKASAAMGLDVRSLGGYVLAPPSYLTDAEAADGTVYSGAYEDIGATTGGTNDPLWWDLIASAIRPVNRESKKPVSLLPSERRASVAALREWVSILQPGERNNGLHWAVCRCIENGIDPHELVEPAIVAGLAEDEILLTIGSALRRAGVSADELETEVEALFPDPV